MLPARTASRGWLAVIAAAGVVTAAPAAGRPVLSHCASTMTKPATMAIRAFAIRKARRYLQRDGEWLLVLPVLVLPVLPVLPCYRY